MPHLAQSIVVDKDAPDSIQHMATDINTIVGDVHKSINDLSTTLAPLNSPVFTGDPQAPTPVTTDNDTSIATTAFVQALIAAAAATTGDLKPTHKTVADTGWILWSDGTIGDASSGSSIRANADTAALFAIYYNGYSDANCPLLTSAGGATTRGAQGTAAAAFAAHCRMSLPLGASAALGIAGTGTGLTARTLGSRVGAETETPTLAKTAAHNHTGVANSAGIITTSTFSAGSNSNLEFTNPGSTASAGSGTPLNIMQPTTFINVMIKL